MPVSEPDTQQTAFNTHLWNEGHWQLSREESLGVGGKRPLPGRLRVPGGQNWQEESMQCEAEFSWTGSGK